MPTPEIFITAQHRLGEAILWHEARQCLYWIDLLDPALFSHDLKTGETVKRALDLVPPIGAIAATTDPDVLMLSHRNGLSLLRIDDLNMTPFCDPEQGRSDVMYNDMKCDRWGRLWAGTSHVGETVGLGSLWCVAGDGRFMKGDTGFPIANGPAFSPDGGTVYFNDSFNYQTLCYEISVKSLALGPRRVFKTYTIEQGMPDGLTVDVVGNIWTAQWGGARIICLSPGGQEIATLPIPAGNVTAMCFGGPKLDILFVTTARDGLSAAVLSRYPLTGSLFQFRNLGQGLPEPLFNLA
jgi:sugar lactone lactonase YvrE